MSLFPRTNQLLKVSNKAKQGNGAYGDIKKKKPQESNNQDT